jgi:HK97 family phage portal protein
MSLDGLVGISPIAFTRRTLEQAAASEKYALSFYSSGGRPRNILTSDAVLKKEKKEELIEAWRGMVEAGTAIIDGGLKYQEVSLPFDDAKYLGSRKFSVADVGRIFGVPLHMIGDLERSTNNNIEHQGIEFWQNTIMPWTVCWEQAITRDLIGPRERATIYPKHNMSAIMRGSYLQRQQGLAIQRQNGVLTGNEWRRLEELNDIVGGDELLINGNMIPAARARGKANHG